MKAAPSYFEWAEGNTFFYALGPGGITRLDTIDFAPGEITDTGIDVTPMTEVEFREHFSARFMETT